MNLFNEKAAVVTGAGSGIGRACALAFAAQDAKVVVADIVVAGGEETVQMIKDAGGEAVFVLCDAASFVTGHALMVDGGYTAQ